MRKEVEEMLKSCDELIELSLKQSGLGLDSCIMSLDSEDFELMQKTIKLYKQVKDLSIEMAEKMDKQDKKLDAILSKLEKLEEK